MCDLALTACVDNGARMLLVDPVHARCANGTPSLYNVDGMHVSRVE